MKLPYVLLTLFAALLAACGDDTTPATVQDVTETPVTLTLTLSAEQGAETRAAATPRQLSSADNWQQATNVRIYAFRAAVANGTYRYVPLTGRDGRQMPYLYAADFGKKLTVWKEEEHGNREESYEYYVRTYLTDGYSYKFLAIGRDDITEDDETQAAYSLNLTVGVTTLEQAQATLSASRLTGTELFAGYNAEPITATTPAKPICRTIELRRAVAGLMLYAFNIPYSINGTQVRHVGIAPAQAAYTAVTLAARTFIGSTTQPQRPFVSLDVPTTWIKHATMNVYVDPADPNPTFLPNQHPSNTLGPTGAFLTPQPAMPDYTPDMGRTPLMLCFYDDNWQQLAAARIKIENDYPQQRDPATGAIVTPTEGTPPSQNNYALLANHIYCLGRFSNTPGIDRPVDLIPDDGGDDVSIIQNHTYIIVWGPWQAEVNIDM